MDGSADSYTIEYSDSDSNEVCNSTTILASACQNGGCQHELEVHSNPCSSSSSYLTVVASASNRLGNGTYSNPVPAIGEAIKKR